MSTTSRLARGRTWPRMLVLVLALLLGAPPVTGGLTAPALAVPGESVEYDVLDTALRPPARSAHRPAAPTRPAAAPHRPAAPRQGPGHPLRPASPRPPYALRGLRTVVLRC
ncbi:hypothetical protein ABZZ79_27385 [Streptomyces sp. NPDC006458]|uniref:hypothetical protein n=1 Tax=Streptomyces sp. NPDC006458 TaxID=3154302 RepID=UPI00339E76A8